MKVSIRKNQLDYFRKKARATPLEIYACLVGKMVGSTVKVVRVEYPELALQTPVSVAPTAVGYNDIRDRALEEDLRVVGTLHSHPNYLPVLSKDDFAGHLQDGDLVTGIVEVTNRKTRVAFWCVGSPLPCEIEHY